MVVRNMLCHFKGLTIQNYIFVGPASDFLIDLARRGYPVIDASNFSDFNKLGKSVNFQDSTLGLFKEILVMASVTRKNLELGYSTWMLEGNVLSRNNDSFFDTFDRTNDLYVGESSRLLFVRHSSSTLKIWSDDLPFKIASLVGSSGKPSVSASIFIKAVEKLLEQQSVKFNNVDEMRLGLDVGTLQANSSSLHGESKFIIWSSKTDLDMLRKQLAQLDFWLLFAIRHSLC